MESATPIIYSPADSLAQRLTWPRLIALGIASGALTLLIVASTLTPSRAGFGTHHGLGMAPCQFLQRTGIPCPSCGMTTSFAWFVRGNLAASLYVQPMGTLLAAFCAATVWAGLYIAITGRPIYRLLNLIPGRYWLIPLLGLFVAGWGWKIVIHLTGHDGW